MVELVAKGMLTGLVELSELAGLLVGHRRAGGGPPLAPNLLRATLPSGVANEKTPSSEAFRLYAKYQIKQCDAYSIDNITIYFAWPTFSSDEGDFQTWEVPEIWNGAAKAVVGPSLAVRLQLLDHRLRHQALGIGHLEAARALGEAVRAGAGARKAQLLGGGHAA